MRIFSSIVLLLTILYLPYWAAILMVISFAFVFNGYYEGLLWGFLADRLYAPDAVLLNSYSMQYFFTFAVIILVAELLKTRLKFYD